MHDFGFCRRSSTFQRQFIEQTSLIVIFSFTVNKHQLRNFIQRIFGDKIYFKYFLEVFDMSKKICKIDNDMIKQQTHKKRPFVIISVNNNKTFSDNLMNFRIDPFKRNLTFRMGLDTD